VAVTLSEGGSITSATYGIEVSRTNGDATITLSEGSSIETTGTAILIINHDEDITVRLNENSSIGTTGSNANGIHASGADGDVNITMAEGSSIITSGNSSDGVNIIETYKTVQLFLHGSITTEKARSYGIYVSSTTGDLQVTSSGTIETNGDYAYGMYFGFNYGKIAVDTATDITTDGENASGIVVWPVFDEDITIINSGEITTSGGSAHGIYVYGFDFYHEIGGDVAITNSGGGSISTSGTYAHGIYVNGVGYITGDVSVDGDGDITAAGDGADGIYVTGVTGAVQIEIGGHVSGGSGDGAGVRLGGGASSSEIEILSSGELDALSDLAIRGSDDGVSITNKGTLTGFIELGDGDDAFDNRSGGQWHLRNGDSTATADFGGGEDSFLNDGTLTLSKGSNSLGQGELIGLESFTNSGSIDLADGVAGDILSISGAFVSDGGSLWLDAVLDDGTTPVADIVELESVTTAGGPTVVWVSNIGGAGGLTSGNGILVIDVAQTSDSDAFALPGTLIAGTYQYQLVQVLEDWYLQSTLFQDSIEYPALVSGALLAWQGDIAAVHGRLADLRGSLDEETITPAGWSAEERNFGPWLHVTGGKQEIGTGMPFDHSAQKLEGGIDGRIEGAHGQRFIFGGFAGSGQTSQEFHSSTSEARSGVRLAGVYGSLVMGGFHADALLKYEHQRSEFNGDATLNEDASYTVDVLGGSFETGYRFAGQSFYLQPRARLSYAHAWAGSFADGGGESIDLENTETLVGEAALRYGARVALKAVNADFYVEAGARHEFLGKAKAEVSGLSFTHELPGTSGLVAGGVSVPLLEDKLSLVVESSYAKGEDAEEFTATGALRVMY
jgi:outer membrane autotransporter protein